MYKLKIEELEPWYTISNYNSNYPCYELSLLI